MRMLLIHGRSQGGKDPVALQNEWLGALDKGLKKTGLSLPRDVQVDFPHYGNQLDKFVEQFKLPADPAIVPKGSPAFDEYAAFRREVADEMRQRAGLTDAQVQAELPPGVPAEKGPQNWEWVQAIVRLLDRHLPDVSQGTIEVFLRDVFLYTKRDIVQGAIDEIVSAKLTPDTTLVVGHSLGSVVGYNVLRAAPKNVKAYITVGSPLGIRAIRRALGAISNPLQKRDCWYNAYDHRDIVALNPLDTANFDVAPAIVNNGAVSNHTDNRHGIIGYLDDMEVARTIHAALR
ncbi:hypothetical protein [Bradyrhizobium sp.]|uniref:hypothetical protein n=1 Tax=Bradyrhizobium sp. TaxID=376 RepID=UPI001DDE3EBF|nr:hypothetical protein [Bradyrhizobium sp.]MBI5320103.1 alpha/beta hydrolase [Bradyrhizobium sp.]